MSCSCGRLVISAVITICLLLTGKICWKQLLSSVGTDRFMAWKQFHCPRISIQLTRNKAAKHYARGCIQSLVSRSLQQQYNNKTGIDDRSLNRYTTLLCTVVYFLYSYYYCYLLGYYYKYIYGSVIPFWTTPTICPGQSLAVGRPTPTNCSKDKICDRWWSFLC